jgi:DNA-binding transcriptional ArsR family regulator
MMENISAIPHQPHSDDMEKNTIQVIKAMKAMSHEVRLMLLWNLSKGEKTVTELADLLHLEQSTISQQLARLRLEGIVKGRRQGRTIHYHIEDMRAKNLIEIICSIYCASKVA